MSSSICNLNNIMNGAVVNNCNVSTKWSDADLGHLDLNTWNYTARNFETSPFPIDPVINSRIALW